MILVLALLATVVLSGCGASSKSSDGGTGFVGGDPGLTQVPVAKRKPAPEVSGQTLDGKDLSIADYHGKVLVINVWGSWCNPCRGEAAGLVMAAEKTKDTAQFLGIDSRDTGQKQAQAFVRTFKVPYPSVWDPSGQQLIKFAGVLPPMSIPSTLIVDDQGRMAARSIGPISEASLVSLVTDVAAGR